MARRIQANPRARVETQRGRRATPLPVDWPARRDAVRRRDLNCRWPMEFGYCASVERLEVDHIDDPTNHDLSNLRLLCHTHHQQRSQQQASANRKTRKRPPDVHPGMIA